MEQAAQMNLSLSPQQIEYVHNVLAERPWKEVVVLMANIGQQVAQQQQATQQPVVGQAPAVQPAKAKRARKPRAVKLNGIAGQAQPVQ